MNLNFAALTLAAMCCFALLVVELSVAARGVLRNSLELRHWTRGSWLILMGLLSFGLRPWIPDGLSVLLTNGCIVAGQYFCALALFRFLSPDRAAPRFLLWFYGGSALMAFAMIDRSYLERVLVLSVTLGAGYLPLVWMVATRGWSRERSLRTMAVTLGFAGAALFVRAAHAWAEPGQYGEPFQASLGQLLVAVSCLVGPIGAGFAFVLANFERVARRLEELASLDALTGCLNRGAADAVIAHALQRGQREHAAVSLLLMDLDHFKRLNDEHGHRIGDEALRQFASVVRARLRASDIFVRMGGEEFAVLLPNTDVPGARGLADDVRQAVQQIRLPLDTGEQAGFTVSVGVAMSASDPAITPERLYARADEALYRAKRAGRNRVECAAALVQRVGA